MVIEMTNINNDIYDIYSFDIFDTLVTRRVAIPKGIFAIMQEKIKAGNYNLDDIVKNNFYNIRVGAESSARMRSQNYNKTVEIFFDDIYELIKSNYSIDDNEILKLKSLEIETEIQNIVPITKNIEKLKKLLDENKKVILISDMYFSEKQLRYILSHIDKVFTKIPLYVSSEYKASKADGLIWDIIKYKENILDNKKWIHTGDDKFADILRAKEKHIKTQYIQKEPLYPFEETLLNSNLTNIKVLSCIGKSRLVRLCKNHNNQKKYEFGASFAGPILCGYVNWILEEAKKKGYKTLYFVSRDGFIPKIIADIFIKKRNLDIKTKYIYGSRKSWRIPTTDTYEEFINSIDEEFVHLQNLKFISMKLNVEEKELEEKIGIKNTGKKFKTKERKKVFEKLRNDINIKNWIIDKNKNKADLLIKYFEQEVDFNEENFAFVDIHGSGRTQYILSKILFPKFSRIINFFYYTPTALESCDFYKIYNYKLLCSHDVLYELLTRNTEGQLLEYIEENGKILPKLEFNEDENLIQWGFDDYLSGIKDYALISSDDIYSPDYYFDYLINMKDKNLAEILGTIVINNSGALEKNCGIIAPKYHSLKILFDFLLCKKFEIDEYIFYKLSMIRSSETAQKIRMFANKHMTLQKLLFNIYVNKTSKIAYIRFLGVKISFKRLIWKK